MNFALSSEQAELKRSARRFFSTHATSERVRAAMASEQGWDAEAWKAACDLGWQALASLGWVEVAVVAEEAGRALACVPLFSSVCLGANALRAAGADEHVARVEAGEALAALASGGGISAKRDGAGVVLTGDAPYVVDGATADLFVVVAPREEGFFLVDARAAGVSTTRTPTLDATRSMATLHLRDVRLAASAHIGDARSVRTALSRAAILLAAESVGAAERCLDMAIDYAKTRVQFGRPIGSFQAIKHRLADLFVAVETARSAAYWAASVAASDDDTELRAAAAVAKAYCTEAFFRCAGESIQVHGGIGFTWEHDAHLFLRRARGSLALLGSPSRDRELIALVALGCG
jgi:alkylation response protein AidB-like acyl-CoA dehydrogenase